MHFLYINLQLELELIIHIMYICKQKVLKEYALN